MHATRSVQGGGCLWCLLVLHLQSVRRNVNRNAGLICSHILSTQTMYFSRRVRLLLIVIAAGASALAETCKPIYRIRRWCNATSEYSAIRRIGLTLAITSMHVQIWGIPFPLPLSYPFFFLSLPSPLLISPFPRLQHRFTFAYTALMYFGLQRLTFIKLLYMHILAHQVAFTNFHTQHSWCMLFI